MAPFLETDGRVKNWPSSLELKQKILRYLADKFEPGRDYKEREVNEILKKWHTFGDLFILRRGLVDSGLLKRERDGSRYWRG
ncbi:MAG: DUF2087 domain-containing protein [Oscillospiraceae bacterium]|nr:DUF2087 domain-containing protein [Oscillospiraceae bacterium]